ncbi:MAG: acyltransferase [Rickettsiales bacterium]|nr:acyltransferase [Rickettsiales bacterium]
MNNKLTSNKAEISSLTFFRFLTAFIVFLFHCKIHLNFSTNIKFIDKFINNGAVFMTGFFVLSGYIMCYVYKNKDFSKRNEVLNFYLKRFAKIYPTYFLGSILYFSLIQPNTPYTSEEWIRIIINDIFLLQAIFPKMFHLGINGGTWSISVEAFFYLLFPLIILIYSKKPIKLIFLGFLMAIIVNINVISDSESKGYYYSNAFMRLNEFFIGIGFYLLTSNNKLDKLPFILKSPFFIFLVIFCLTTLKQSEAIYSYMGLNIVIAPLFGLLLFSLSINNNSFVFNNRYTNYLGKISYSFYIWQFIAIEFGRGLIKLDINNWLIIIIVFMLNILIASISYFLVEEKFRKIIINRFSNYSN